VTFLLKSVTRPTCTSKNTHEQSTEIMHSTDLRPSWSS